MLRALMVVVVIAGCATTDDSATAECRSDAAANCESIGYGDNAMCLIVFAQDCSPEDARAANAACCAAEGLAVGSECHLTWR